MKRHTFKHGQYNIVETERGVDGWCDIPDNTDRLWMFILSAPTFKGFLTAMHEAEHADGIPEKYTHGDGECDCERRARFLWRWLNEHFDIKPKKEDE